MSVTHKFNIGGHEGYITVGLYPDGDPGEIFIKMAKEGSTVSGLMDSFALAVSMALQHGVPLKLFCEKFAHTRFEPARLVQQSRHRLRQVDHGLHLPLAPAALPHRTAAVPVRKPASEDDGRCNPPAREGIVEDLNADTRSLGTENRELRTGKIHAADALAGMIDMGDAPSCHVCGSIMVRNGSCYKCMSCGSTSGCS